MKKYKDSIKTVLVLALIALASGLLLSVVNTITQVDEEAVLREKIALAYPNSPVERELDVSNYDNLPDSEIQRAYLAADSAMIILAHSVRAYDSSGLELLVIIKDNQIISVSRYRANETPGLGSVVLEKDYLDVYIGIDLEKFQTTALDKGEDTDTVKNIDARSGATVTSKAVNSAVNGAIAFYMEGYTTETFLGEDANE